MMATKPTTRRRSTATQTMGQLLTHALADHGAATRLADASGITLSYLSRMRHDRVWNVSRPVKQSLAAALGTTVDLVSAALSATERKATATRQKTAK